MIIIAKLNKAKTLYKNNDIISKIRNQLKQEGVVSEICTEHGFDTSIIDGIVIMFDPTLDVSAKTINSKISLNEKLKADDCDGEPWSILMRYAIHELTHALQHMAREGEADADDGKDYLDRDDEMEAFQNQIQFDLKERGPDAVIDYIDDLLEYHEVDDVDNKKSELLDKVTS